jgi:PAS domain S-box-containing protein
MTYEELIDRNRELEIENSALKNHILLRQQTNNYSNLTQTLAENAQHGFIIYDKDLKYRVWNKYMEEISGIPAATIIGKYPWDFFPFLEETDVITKLKNILNTGEPFRAEIAYKIPETGKEGWIINFYSPLYDSDNKITGIFAIAIDTTIQKQTEQLLVAAKETAEESQKKFKAIADTSPMAIYISKGVEQVAEYINPTFYNLFGYSYDEVSEVALWWPRAYPEIAYQHQVRDEWNSKTEKAIRAKTDIEPMEVVVTCKNGSKKNILWGFVSTGDENWAFGMDLTSYRKTEQELVKARIKAERNEIHFKAIAEQAMDGITLADFNGNYIFVNRAFSLMIGYTEDELLKMNVFDLKIKDDDSNTFQSILQHGQSLTLSKRLQCKNGDIIYVDINGKKISAEKEEFILGIVRNVTDKIVNEQQLIAAKEKAEKSERKIKQQNEDITFNNDRLESLLRISQYSTESIQELLDFALGEAVTLTKSKIGYIYFYNAEKEQFSLNTWSREVMSECAVLNPQTIYNLDKTGCWGEAVRQRRPIIINDYPSENILKKGIPEGHVKLLKFLTIPVFSQEKIVAVAGVANKETDYDNSDIRQLTLLMDTVWKISERILLISDLKQAKEKAEESDRLKTAFLQNMSHEIRTPMNAIMGFSELLAQNIKNEEKIDHFVSIINQRCSDLLVIIDDILDIAKIESGQLQINNETINIIKLLKDLELIYNQQKIHLKKPEIKIALNIPPGLQEFRITSDKSRLMQVFNNLLSNALKYTLQGEITYGFQFNSENQIEFYVSDTGIGIPHNKHSAIFERFVQLNQKTVRSMGGTGLGLSITRALVKLLGGEIWLHSEIDKGSTFYFTINANSEIASTTSVSIPSHSLNSDTISGKTVLIVEDDEFNKALIKEILENLGPNLIFSSSGNDSVNICSNTHIDLVLMDIDLPDISGYEATKLILSKFPEMKIIAQTAYASGTDKFKAYESGCIEYISKPLKARVLIDTIKNHI